MSNQLNSLDIHQAQVNRAIKEYNEKIMKLDAEDLAIRNSQIKTSPLARKHKRTLGQNIYTLEVVFNLRKKAEAFLICANDIESMISKPTTKQITP